MERQLVTPVKGVAIGGPFLDVWTDRDIEVGEYWFQKIIAAMDEADVAILLVTADSLLLDFFVIRKCHVCFSGEKEEGMRIYPIIVDPARGNKSNG